MRKDDRYRPNHILGTLLVTAGLLVFFMGQSLWIPASRIGNLHIRSVVLALADSGASLASASGLDVFVPGIRQAFLDASGLSENSSWDTRYFNRRNAAAVGGYDDAISIPPASGADQFSAGSDLSAAGIADAPAAVSPDASASGAPGSDDPAVSGFAENASFADDPEANLSTPGLADGSVATPGKAASGSIMHSVDNPLSVYMFGDSQVFSLGSGLSRLAGKDSPVKVDFLAIHSSGFIREDYYNWPAKLADTLNASSYNAVAMMLGMNDYQSFRDSTGAILKKRTPEWEAAYKSKCRELIDIALVSVPRVYWIGMPVVKNAVYSDSLAYIDSVQQSLAGEYSPDVLVRISIADIIPGKGKKFAESIDTGEGKLLQVMGGDGSHFTVEGGEIVMQPLFDRLVHDYLFTEVPVAHRPG